MCGFTILPFASGEFCFERIPKYIPPPPRGTVNTRISLKANEMHKISN